MRSIKVFCEVQSVHSIMNLNDIHQKFKTHI